MKIKFLGDEDIKNYGVLAFNRKSDFTAKVHHFNEDDGHYSYSYNLTGTKTELDVIEEFCARLTGHYGKRNPYMSLDCEHQYEEVSPKKANKESNYTYGNVKLKVHPGLKDYKVLKCKICKEYQWGYIFKGYPVELFSSEFNRKDLKYHQITVWVHPMPFEKVPKSVGDEMKRHLTVDPEEEKKLISLGFKRTGGYSGSGWASPEKHIYFSFKYPNPLKDK